MRRLQYNRISRVSLPKSVIESQKKAKHIRTIVVIRMADEVEGKTLLKFLMFNSFVKCDLNKV